MSATPHKIPQAVKSLITRITNLALRINERGHYHAFIDLAGHVDSIYIRIHPATDDYHHHPDPIFIRNIYYIRRPARGYAAPEAQEKPLKELNEVLNELKPYLNAPKAQEVAA